VSTPRRAGPSSYFDPARIGALEAETASLVRRRLDVLGPAYRLFYEQPLQIVRGEGVHLYDADGGEYLDAYNNVASAGHAHPRVTAAIAAQAGVLNTHTRYLHEGIVRYSEELLATLPAELGHVMFTCTGSEAGDLALRIAKHHTGGTGVVVTRNAYHGVTTEVAAISPSLGGVDSLAPWARWVEAPDAYRVDHEALGFASLGEWFAAQVQAAVDDLAEHGVRLAAFVADSIFASDGVLPDPAGFLAPAVEVVRRAGGVWIADEVQPGFGRTGEAMWGFQRHGAAADRLVPDLVTVGKPMGNGMPIAAAIMRPEVIEEFGREVRYFNTFGGNAVSIAAAQAVLDVIRDEGLQANAAQVGTLLKAMLAELAARHPAVGDVRGAGLFVGIELVRPGGRDPDEDLALRAVNGMRRRHVLIGTAGLHNNVLKVRPPLVFSRTDAERFVGELDATLAEAG
jgi:4-aminobutyrate aminotransferase-like enzyme